MLKRLFLSLCLLAITLPGFAKPDNLADKQILRRGNGSEVQTLDPHKAEGVPASNILRDLYEGLTIEALTEKSFPAPLNPGKSVMTARSILSISARMPDGQMATR